MGKVGRIAVVFIVAIAAVAVISMEQSAASPPSGPSTQTAGGLPRLVGLGSTTCIPCKMMTPVLDELAKEYAGRMQVEFVNVNEKPDIAKSFGIKLIPTQVFIDSSGKELWRHEGFIAKQDILAKWQELGVKFAATPMASSRPTSAPASSSAPVR